MEMLGSLQHLYAMVAAVDHNDASFAVYYNATGTIELQISITFFADGSNMGAVWVA